MERHKCKLCSRTFSNGRALGGHMKAHLAIAKSQKQQTVLFSSSSSESEQEQEREREREREKTLVSYGLRENPKKSLKIADPGFSSVIVQDRESETESKNNPTRQQRSKRIRKHISSINNNNNNNNNQKFELKKAKMNFMVPTATLLPFIESTEPVSSVSDTSPEEDVAMCLMMLSRDKWNRRNNMNNVVEQEEEGSVKKIANTKLLKRVRGKHFCENCRKMFRSSRALGSHTSVCCRGEAKNGNDNHDKIFECPFCFKVFGSGQALGGHKRSHLIPSSSNTTPNVNVNLSATFKETFIDLNLPAPVEEDDLSVVSYA